MKKHQASQNFWWDLHLLYLRFSNRIKDSTSFIQFVNDGGLWDLQLQRKSLQARSEAYSTELALGIVMSAQQ